MGFVVPAVGFGLGADARLRRLARAVRFLDIGGIAVAEPAGLRTVRSGLREKHADDDHPTLAAAAAFDARYAAAATPP